MSQARLQIIREAVPVALQVCGLLGFVAAQILWLGFKRPEPEFVGFMILVATGGYAVEGFVKSLSKPASGSDR